MHAILLLNGIMYHGEIGYIGAVKSSHFFARYGISFTHDT